MKVSVAGEQFACSKAVRDGDKATLFLDEGGTAVFSGVHDWDAFTLEGGAWSLPDVTPQEQLRADVDFLAAMTGVSL